VGSSPAGRNSQIPSRIALEKGSAATALSKRPRSKNAKKLIDLRNSESVCRKHYVEVVSPEDGRAWFGLSRQSASDSASEMALERVSNLSRSLASLDA
jgi:hypothetical protein